MVYFIEIGIKYGILIIGRMPGTWLKLAVCAPLLNSYRDTLAVRAGEASGSNSSFFQSYTSYLAADRAANSSVHAWHSSK